MIYDPSNLLYLMSTRSYHLICHHTVGYDNDSTIRSLIYDFPATNFCTLPTDGFLVLLLCTFKTLLDYSYLSFTTHGVITKILFQYIVILSASCSCRKTGHNNSPKELELHRGWCNSCSCVKTGHFLF